MKALFDTCILIDYLNGIEEAKQELERFEAKAISVITWMEVMVGTDEHTENETRSWLNRTFELIGVSANVSVVAVNVRKNMRIKLPDAIIYASARSQGSLFVTRNTKDFSSDDPIVRVPYQLEPK